MKRLLLVPAIAITAFLIACSDDDTDIGDRADIDATPQADGLQFVVDSLGTRMDLTKLRTHLDDSLQDLEDEDLAHAAICFPTDADAQILDQEIEENGEQATLFVTWAVTNVGEDEDETLGVERNWEFTRISNDEDPAYVVSGLPECPFEPGDRLDEDEEPEDELDDDDVVPAPTP